MIDSPENVTYMEIDRKTKEHKIIERPGSKGDNSSVFMDQNTIWIRLDDEGWIRHVLGSEIPVPANYFIKVRMITKFNHQLMHHEHGEPSSVVSGTSANIDWNKVHSYKLISYRDSRGHQGFQPTMSEELNANIEIEYPCYLTILDKDPQQYGDGYIPASLFYVRNASHLEELLLESRSHDSYDCELQVIYNQKKLTVKIRTSITIAEIE